MAPGKNEFDSPGLAELELSFQLDELNQPEFWLCCEGRQSCHQMCLSGYWFWSCSWEIEGHKKMINHNQTTILFVLYLLTSTSLGLYFYHFRILISIIDCALCKMGCRKYIDKVREGCSLLNTRWMDLFSALTLMAPTRSQNWVQNSVLSASRKTSGLLTNNPQTEWCQGRSNSDLKDN